MANFLVTSAGDVGEDGAIAADLAADRADGGGLSLREALHWANADPDADAIGFAGGAGEAFRGGATIALAQGQLAISTTVTIDGDLDGDGAPDVTLDAGGASRVLAVTGGTATLRGLTVTGGLVDHASDGYDGGYGSGGGGIHVASGATLDFSDGAITGNRFRDDYHFQEAGGGGLDNEGTVTLTNTVVSDNEVDRFDGLSGGGGFFNRGVATLRDVTLSGNDAKYGGGLFNYDGTATLTNVTVVGNGAEYGGGVFSYGTATLTNVTLSGNEAGRGGALYNLGTATLTNATVSGNGASHGGGLYMANGTTTLVNTIVLGNRASVANAEIQGSASAASASNLIGDGTIAPGAVFAALDAEGGGLLADHGGPVSTIALRADAANPALDAGDDAAAPSTDARGLARPKGGASDLGAFELQHEAPVVVRPLADRSFDEDRAVSFALPSDAFADLDAGDVLTLAATLAGGAALPGWLRFDPATGAFSGTPPRDFAGTLSVAVTATDLLGLSAADAFDLAIRPVDDPAVVGGDATGEVGEDGVAMAATASGRLSATDVDGPADLFAAMLAGEFAHFKLRITKNERWLSIRDRDAMDGLDEGRDIVGADVETLAFGDGVVVSLQQSGGMLTGYRAIDAEGVLIGSHRILDDGERLTETFEDGHLASRLRQDAKDDASTAIWRRIEKTFDDGHRSVKTFEDGTIASKVLRDAKEGGGTALWKKIEVAFDEAGTKASRVVAYDDGDVRVREHEAGLLRRSTLHDGSDERDWVSRTTVFDEAGAVLERSYDWGDGPLG